MLKTKLALITLTIFSLLYLMPGPTMADSSGPAITSISPARNSYVKETINDPISGMSVPVNLTIEDPDGIMDGSEIITSNYGYARSEYVKSSEYKKYITVYVPVNPNDLTSKYGNLEMSFRDKLGNISRYTHFFNLDLDTPYITYYAPHQTGYMGISINLQDNSSPLNPNTMVVKMDGQVITPTSLMNFPADRKLQFSYRPSVVPLGQHTIEATFSDVAGNTSSFTWNAKLIGYNDPPKIISITPEGLTTKSTHIEALVETPRWLQPTSTIKIMKYDGTYLPITTKIDNSVDEGISKIYADLADPLPEGGTYEVTASLLNYANKTAVKTWTFTPVKDYPLFSNMTPMPSMEYSSNPGIISTRVTDSSNISSSGIVMEVDNTPVAYTESRIWNGADLSYVPANLAPGLHTVRVSVKDGWGIPNEQLWTFRIVPDGGPASSQLNPPAFTNYTGNLVSAWLKDGDGLAEPQPMEIESPTGEKFTVATSYESGSGDTYSHKLLADLTALNLPEGISKISMLAKDNLGNLSTTNWSYNRFVDKPAILSETPVGNITDASPAISARLTDSSGINPSTIVMKIDGNPVEYISTATINGYNISYTPSIPYPAQTKHNVEITANDTKGNASNKSWSFYVSSLPTASLIAPANGSTVDQSLTNNKTNISIHFQNSDGLIGVVTTMIIDGKSVTPNVNLTNNDLDADISYGFNLAGGSHNVQVKVTNKKGISATESWNFSTNSYKDMDTTGNETCIGCHKGSEVAEFNDLHSAINRDPSRGAHHAFNCYRCHGNDLILNNYKEQCALCHNYPYDGIFKSNPVAHGGTYDYKYKDHNDPTKYDVTTPRTNFDCVYCHQQNSVNSNQIAQHDIIGDHQISLPDPYCQKCHTDSLTREHARYTDANGKPKFTCQTCHASADTKVKSAVAVYEPFIFKFHDYPYLHNNSVVEHSIPGKKITGARLNIKNQAYDGTFVIQGYYNGAWQDLFNKNVSVAYDSIYRPFAGGSVGWSVSQNMTFPPTDKLRISYSNVANQTIVYLVEVKLDNWQFENPDPAVNCNDCHDAHGADHASGLEQNCIGCHQGNVMNEHKSRGTKCQTCHESTDINIIQSLNWRQKACNDCHSTGHGVALAASVPAEIPLNPSFQWTPPVPLDLYAGENWIPHDGLGKRGKVLMSNRINTTAESVWLWYSTQFQQSGWTLIEGQPAAGTDFYKVTFAKGDKRAVLWIYGGLNHSAGPISDQGYKTELIYY